MNIRNWRDQIPYIGHESKITWPLLTRARDDADASASACLLALGSLTRQGAYRALSSGRTARLPSACSPHPDPGRR